MNTRPEILFPLFAELNTLTGVGDKSAKAFSGLKITKPRDLIFTLPHSVVDRGVVQSVQGLTAPQTLSVRVRVVKHVPARGRGKPYRIIVEDAQSTIELIFFHARGDYLERILPLGEERLISGKLEVFDHRAQMVHPEYILRPEAQDKLPQFEPVYPLTAGVSGKLMGKAVRAAVDKLPDLLEWIEPSVLRDNGWPNFTTAVRQCHAPKGAADVAAHSPARERLAYDEFLAHQLTKAIARAQARVKTGRITAGIGDLQRKVLEQLPYAPTGAQRQAISEIGADMASSRRMNRLLQGDVGAGKTLVGFMALLQAVESGGQGVLMAPTEILARQHLESLRPLADRAGVRVDMLTGRDKSAARRQKLDDLANGAIDILVGTHAVFQDAVAFKDLRLSIIDEQHRFGVQQRLALGAKGTKVDVLVMSATPIPRSLELAQYGDMDVSALYEKPPGRKPITTAAVPLSRLADVIAKLKAAIASGRQAYWVCPLLKRVKPWI